MPTNLTWKQAQARLLRGGWQLERQKSHHIFKKAGAPTLTINSSGQLNPWLTQKVLRLTSNLDGVPGYAGPHLPLMVRHYYKEYAVVTREGDRYILQDLEDGSQITAKVERCIEVTATLPRMTMTPEPPAQMEEPMTAETEPTQLMTPTQMRTVRVDNWLSETRRLIEHTEVQIEALKNQIAPLEQQKKQLEAAIAAFAGSNVTTKAKVHETKVQPKRGNKPNPNKERIIELYAMGKTTGDIATELGLNYGTVYQYRPQQ